MIPVNCVGVMGAGLARWAKQLYGAHLENDLKCLGLYPGDAKWWPPRYPKQLLAIATKDRWEDVSKYEWIERGLMAIPEKLRERRQAALFRDIDSIAIPRVGCGLGGLRWDKARVYLKAMDKAGPEFLYEVYEEDTKGQVEDESQDYSHEDAKKAWQAFKTRERKLFNEEGDEVFKNNPLTTYLNSSRKPRKR